MITKDTFPQLLESLGFTKRKTTYSKTFGAATLYVETARQEIIYPEDQGFIVNERQTCNFSKNENFVVFECIHRLLEKGYKPEHMELEPKWKLGLGPSGGRADILIKDNEKKALLIIECKTPGSEFKKAWNKTLQDGGQLFSYAQQITETQFLCLYTSDFSENAVTYQSHIIAHRDNEKYLADNPLFKSFESASDVKDRFAVWRDTYKLDFTTKGIFEDNIQPYHIGKDKYTIADLKSISADDQQKKYHEFATILRQHNVSGRENAFDKLVNLFLCKLVDETENPQDLKFYWKGVAYDTHFEMLDRLQQLYQAGMKKFLGEEITYINQNDVNNALRFIRQNPDATQRAVWNLFTQQKFFTNNDFSMIDVHNEKLFYQNAEVLLKILQMWQDIRLTNPNGHHQFLGDMFEGFLDQGIKQSEGQYFTPMPLCRFILMSLPLETLIKNSAAPPKAIDFACGAGHFLNELALQILPMVKQHKEIDISEYNKAIFGVEKEYRLSKVAKVSAFMYGQQNINICYGDALINAHDAFPEIRDNSFDLLVSNPPYSVRGFLETLPEEERTAYSLTDTIDKLDTNNSIETFFIERAKQLLKAGGVAAIILPSSILSNGNNTYVKTREILLQYFDIVAIAEFGSGTFGKTGTNTVTLFLRRKETTPDTAAHYRERVAEWFNSDENQAVYKDAHLIDRYAAHIGASPDDYKTLLNGQPNDSLLAHDTFAQYRKKFDASTEIVNLKKQKGFKAKPKTEQDAELDKRFLAFVQAIERDKVYYFVLAGAQPNPVLIIKSPTDNKLQKKFLGYEWSDSKGSEGIKLLKDAHGNHLTPLYDETDRDNAGKINRYVADNFDGKLGTLPPDLSDFATTARLMDMLDFSRVTFEKQIALSVQKTIHVQSKWPLANLSALVEIISGGTPDTGKPLYWNGDIPWLSVADFSTKERFVFTAEKSITQEGLKNSSTKLLQVGDLIISARGTVGALAQLKTDMAFNQSCYGLRSKTNISNDYIFYSLKREIQQLKAKAFGSKFDAITIKTFEEVKLPVPPLDIQKQIVTECEAVDAEVAEAQKEIDAAQTELIKIAADLRFFPLVPISEVSINLDHKRVPVERNKRKAGGYPYYGASGIVDYVDSYLIDDVVLLISEDGANLKSRVTPIAFTAKGKIWVNNHAHIIKFNNLRIHKLIELYINHLDISEYITGSAQPKLSQSNLNRIKVPVPPVDEQHRLISTIETLEKTITTAQATIAAAPAKKQAIMQRYL